MMPSKCSPVPATAIVVALALLMGSAILNRQAHAEGDSARFAFRPAPLVAIDRAIEAAIDRREIPGAVLHVESHGLTHHRAYGQRALIPKRLPMTETTVFDLASLTKVLATTPAILKLIEDGTVELDGLAIKWLPELIGDASRERITVRQLLTHTSGLIPVVRRRDPWWGYDTAIERATKSEMWAKPDEKWRYSDVNFILLGEIVHRASGRRLDRFVQEEIYQQLGMADTGFLPDPSAIGRIAPTEDRGGYGLIHGVVHDPVARRMGGVAGHAGLFSTTADIAKMLRMLLNGGELNGTRIFKAETVALMTRVQTPEHISETRGLGWDIGSPYSGQRGERFVRGTGFGHTGWTGTCLWVDPGSQTFYILLANRNHPSEKGKIKNLRYQVGSLVAEAVGIEKQPDAAQAAPSAPVGPVFQTAADPPATDDGAVLNGIDQLVADDFAALDGLRVGLITNHTGIDRQRRTTIDLLHAAKNVELVALFSPEHGIRGTLDTSNIDDSVDTRTGLPIYSLYKSDNRKPSDTQLASLDALVFDIQDIGCRFYTYIGTMGGCMEAAADHDLRFVVLDRVNPIGGNEVDGPVRARDGPRKFTAWHPIPVRHGMTVGELAAMFAEENRLDLDLTVVPVQGWRRDIDFDQTGLPWVNPSPNMRSLTQALLYPGVGLLEFTNISVGRGTDTPFEIIGAPWIDDLQLAEHLTAAKLPGIRFIPIRFTPDASVHADAECGGVRFVISERQEFRPIDLGLTLARTLHRLYPEDYNLREKFDVLLQHPATLEAVAGDQAIETIRQGWQPDLDEFLARRAKFLRYEKK
jgi:uncharacterized protein YbbC (DUF1343 family)/CubicO group peptidase (beta-lactamase class C family)